MKYILMLSLVVPFNLALAQTGWVQAQAVTQTNTGTSTSTGTGTETTTTNTTNSNTGAMDDSDKASDASMSPSDKRNTINGMAGVNKGNRNRKNCSALTGKAQTNCMNSNKVRR